MISALRFFNTLFKKLLILSSKDQSLVGQFFLTQWQLHQLFKNFTRWNENFLFTFEEISLFYLDTLMNKSVFRGMYVFVNSILGFYFTSRLTRANFFTRIGSIKNDFFYRPLRTG